MAHLLSDVAGFWMDNASAALTDISGSINSAGASGGNNLVDDTGLGDANHTEIRDIGAVKKITVSGFINSTTEAIIMPLVAAGTSVAKTVQLKIITGQYLSGESNVGPVSWSGPIGLQTFTVEFSSLSGAGFDRTSVALS